MESTEITRLDPWRKKPCDDSSLEDAVFVGRFDVYIGIDTIQEALFLGKGSEGRELWAVQTWTDQDMDSILQLQAARDPSWRKRAFSIWMAAACTSQGSDEDAALELVQALQRACIGYVTPCKPFHGGLLSAETLSRVVSDLHAEFERNRQAALSAALENITPIIEMARSLGLQPEPAGHSPNAWTANCPCGGNHGIMISASANAFGCGYCRRKGGPEELRRFVEDNRKPTPRG